MEKNKERSANAIRQARYRERKATEKTNLSDSDSVRQIVLPDMVLPQQVANSLTSPLVTLGDNVNRSVKRSFDGYELNLSGYALAGLGGYGGFCFVQSMIERPSMKDYIWGIGAGTALGIVADVALNRLLGTSASSASNINSPVVADFVISSENTAIQVVTGAEMQTMSFAGVQLRGEFSDIIGHKVPLHGSIQVVGDSGQGKSHFLTKFVSEFTPQCVLYVSTEEEISEYVSERFLRYDVNDVPFATISYRHELISLIEKYKPRILVVDSISNLGLTQNDIRELVKSLSNRVDLLLYSLHATKDGDFQGSMSLLHDATVQVRVESGLATVKKNRCGKIGRSLDLFSPPSSSITLVQRQQ